MNSKNIADLQQLSAEEIEEVAGAGGKNTCSPSFTCARTTCSETVVETEEN